MRRCPVLDQGWPIRHAKVPPPPFQTPVFVHAPVATLARVATVGPAAKAPGRPVPGVATWRRWLSEVSFAERIRRDLSCLAARYVPGSFRLPASVGRRCLAILGAEEAQI